jgi:hypothetical protein
MTGNGKTTIPFGGDARVSEGEIKSYLNTFVEEYRNITTTDLPEVCEQFPLWAYPVRIVAGLTKSNVYFFVTRDGDPKENKIEICTTSNVRNLVKVMDAFDVKGNEVAKILGIADAIAHWIKAAKAGEFDDNAAKTEAATQVRRHYQNLASTGVIERFIFSDVIASQYLPPVSFLENHVDSTELRDKIIQMLEEAKLEIVASGWLDTYLLDVLQRKSKSGVKIRVLTKKPDKDGPMPNRTAYKRIAEIAQVKRNDLWHFRMIICDLKEVIVSSADLTTHSMTQNFEAGLWTSSPVIVQRAFQLFERVWNHGDTIDVNQEIRDQK